MYECPNECGSREFIQTVEQTETVHVNDAGDPDHFEKHGQGPVREVTCGECGAVIETDRRGQDETARQLYDLLGTAISRGRAGEWNEAVDTMQELDNKLSALIGEGGS